MPTLRANDIEICYESFGDPDAPPLLLVMGLGAQMTLWSPGFVTELLDRNEAVARRDFSIEHMAGRLQSVLDAAGWWT